jgi:4-amino-4-deoxy-L-arabinose transferase-like glycosyltransferase
MDGIRPRLDWRRAASIVFALAGLSVMVGALNQPVEYDEAITILIAGGNGVPAWPSGVTLAATAQELLNKSLGFTDVLKDVRDTDVHPPVYYLSIWLVQLLSGPNIFVDRCLSLVMLIGLFAWLRIWRRYVDGTPGTAALFAAIYLSLFGVYYMATTARGYALASMLLSITFASLLRLLGPLADDDRRPSQRLSLWLCLAIGLTAGLAVLANYLAALIGGGIVAVALVTSAARRQWREIAILVLGSGLPVAIAAYFFIYQVGTRPDYLTGFAGVFTTFGRLIARMFFYVPAEIPPKLWHIILLYPFVGIALLGGVMVVVRRTHGVRVVALAGGLLVAHLIGLVVLSALSDKTLAEARYVALAAPFLAAVLTLGIHRVAQASHTKPVLATLPYLMIAAHLVVTMKLDLGPGVQEWTRIARRAAATAPAETLLVIDRGYGRGVPAAIALSAAPGTRILIAGISELGKSEVQRRIASNRHVHLAISYKSKIEGRIQMFDRYFSSMGYHTKARSRYYRYFTR